MNWSQLIHDLIFVYIPSVFKQIGLLCCGGWDAVKDYRRSFFAKLLQGFPTVYNAKVKERKERLFLDMLTLKSADLELAKRNKIRILEIGIGSGANLQFYPKGSHLVAVDPNPYFEDYFAKNLEKNKGIILEKWVQGYGEDLSEIPTGSIDAVVTTLVLCSVQDLEKVFSEIKRVLSPDGRYYFMEHVNYEAGCWKHTLLQILNFTRIWPLFFDGCHILDARAKVKKSLEKYFPRLEQWERFYLDTSGLWVFEVISPHVSGIVGK